MRRYLPLEIAGTAAMLLTAQVAHWATGSLVMSAIAGAAGENVGYYGVAVARSWLAERPVGRWSALGYALRGLMIVCEADDIVDTIRTVLAPHADRLDADPLSRSGPLAAALRPYVLAGPTCDSTDIIAADHFAAAERRCTLTGR